MDEADSSRQPRKESMVVVNGLRERDCIIHGFERAWSDQKYATIGHIDGSLDGIHFIHGFVNAIKRGIHFIHGCLNMSSCRVRA